MRRGRAEAGDEMEDDMVGPGRGKLTLRVDGYSA